MQCLFFFFTVLNLNLVTRAAITLLRSGSLDHHHFSIESQWKISLAFVASSLSVAAGIQRQPVGRHHTAHPSRRANHRRHPRRGRAATCL